MFRSKAFLVRISLNYSCIANIYVIGSIFGKYHPGYYGGVFKTISFCKTASSSLVSFLSWDGLNMSLVPPPFPPLAVDLVEDCLEKGFVWPFRLHPQRHYPVSRHLWSSLLYDLNPRCSKNQYVTCYSLSHISGMQANYGKRKRKTHDDINPALEVWLAPGCCQRSAIGQTLSSGLSN